jgi:hypothetical protein
LDCHYGLPPTVSGAKSYRYARAILSRLQ